MKSDKIACVVNYSGGAGSYVAAKRAISRYGVDRVVLLFCDTLIEDSDLYRFLDETEDFLGIKVTRIADGRDIWEVFRDVRFLGNSKVAACSRILKRELGDRWIKEHATSAVLAFGIDYSEAHRAKRLRAVLGELAWFPLLDRPLVGKSECIGAIEADGIAPPRLYGLGASHNNCGGACVKAGHAHWRWLHRTLPCVYAEWERKEEELREFLGSNVSILSDRRGGEKTPMTLREFRAKIEVGTRMLFEEEWGGCGCFLDDDS